MRPTKKSSRRKNKNTAAHREVGPGVSASQKNRSGGFRPKPKHASASENKEQHNLQARKRKTGVRPSERLPVILETLPDNNYSLLDSGNGLKLEQYGGMRLIRPEQQAIWGRSQDDREWDRATAYFTGDTDEEGVGRWRFTDARTEETWPMAFDGIPYLGRFTSFRHVGVFPEQAVHWRKMSETIKNAQREIRVLNLFGYTGLASLVAAAAGAHVTHVDASKKAIGWAKDNQAIAKLEDRPIRWICEDAMKFVQREVRRGNKYDIILLDPPAYGRGPKGEVWQLFDHLPDMVDGCRDILSDAPAMLVLTSYAIRASFFAIHEVVMDSFTDFKHKGLVESGELIIREKFRKRALSTSMFSRWTPGARS